MSKQGFLHRRLGTSILTKSRAIMLCAAYVFTLGFTTLYSGRALAFSGVGAGTSGSPYQITTCAQLQEMSGDLSAHYKLMNNIDCSVTSSWNSGAGFMPVGADSSTPFTGGLDGNNKVVSGLFINRTGFQQYTGLFGYASGSTVQNLGLENLNITTDGSYAGGLGGQILNTTLQNVYTTGVLNSTTNTLGGLVGRCDNCTITDSHSAATVSADDSYAGGLVGDQEQGSIDSSYATGNVTGGDSSGGLVGYQYGDISNSYATGNVFTNYAGGGLVGEVDSSSLSITNSYATGTVTEINTDSSPDGDGFGGLVGYSYATVSNSYATGAVHVLDVAAGYGAVGGLIGLSDSGSAIESSYATGAITADAMLGNNIGGLVGENHATTTGSFWDTQTTGQFTGCGANSANCNGASGKTTTQMKDEATFQAASWSIATTATNRNNGYPFLSWETGGSTPTWYIYVAPLTDGDGVADAVEDAAPNSGDGNNDGTQDSQQANVVSFIDASTNKYVTLEVNSACTLTTATSAAESAQTTADSSFDYPAGLVNFTANCGTPGFTTTVTQYYHGVANNNFALRKYNPTTKTYSTVNGATLTQATVGGQTATKAVYQITDGGGLDTDGAANGTIVDPVGLALAASANSSSSSNSSSNSALANTGLNQTMVLMVAGSLVLAGLSVIYIKRSLAQ